MLNFVIANIFQLLSSTHFDSNIYCMICNRSTNNAFLIAFFASENTDYPASSIPAIYVHSIGPLRMSVECVMKS